VYERIRHDDDIEPGRLLPADRVITRGSGRYHAARRAGARHAV
jgi:phenylalanine-4-hydroxylase